MTKYALPSPEDLRQLLSYDPESGILMWRSRSSEWFISGARSAQGCANNWNSMYADKRAGGMTQIGYRYISLPGGAKTPEHRVIWAMAHNRWPKFIDHIDGDRTNNRLYNLREVSKAENSQNIAIPSDNTSGHIGVSWCKAYGKWQTGIGVNGKRVALGRYADLADAIKARKEAEIKYGYHANHGRVARLAGG